MTRSRQIYKCNVCGNLVEVLHNGAGELVCCGQPMELMPEKNQDQGLEKHVPVIEKTEKGILVKIGSIPHPMEPAHYIEWIEVIADGKSYKKFLNPGDKPEAKFEIEFSGNVRARDYCNVHGLWRS